MEIQCHGKRSNDIENIFDHFSTKPTVFTHRGKVIICFSLGYPELDSEVSTHVTERQEE